MFIKKFFRIALPAVCAVILLGVPAHAQFKSQAFKQQYNKDDPKASKDSADVLFSFKEYFAGLWHKQEIKIGTMFAGSLVIPGGEQIYNRQYWKLPIAYSAMAGGLASGIILNKQGRKDVSKWCFVGAGVAYWVTLLDGVICYKPSIYPHAGKATLYSILVPGLGQLYNHEIWKLPIYLGGMGFAIHLYIDNNNNYERFRRIYKEATDPEVPYTGPITAEQALYYRNIHRRYRDWSMVAIIGVYLLQVFDANVFSYMHNFEMDDNLAIKLEPTVIVPDNQYALTGSGAPAAIGLKMGFSF